MSLPTRQQHVLDQIDRNLQLADPRLKCMFSTFTRLTSREAMPVTEAIYARLPRPALLISVMIIAVFTAVVLGALIQGPVCPRVPATGGSARTMTRTITRTMTRAPACRAGTATANQAGR